MKTLRVPLAASCALVALACLSDDLVIGDETVAFGPGERAFGSLTMGCAANGIVSRLEITGGTTVFSGAITMNGPRNRTTSTILVGGDATVALGDITCNSSWANDTQTARLVVTNAAQVTLGDYKGNRSNGPVWQEAVFAGDSRTVQADGKRVETFINGRAYTRIDAIQNAHVELWSPSLGFKDAAGRSPGHLHVRDSATVVLRGPDGETCCEDADGPQSNGVVVADSGALVLDGTFRLGGAVGTGGLVLRDDARMTVTSAGSLVIGWSRGQSGVLTLEGGARLVSTNSVVMLRGYDGDVGPAVIRLDGGVMQVAGFVQGGVLNNPADGDRRIYANGGTLKPMGDRADFLRFFTTAEMSGEGLTLDTDGHDVSIRQAFTGTKVQKAGAGALTVGEDSAHETTVVRGGTLRFPAGVTRFGRAVVVAGGTVSTAGEGTGFGCDALTLGDGTAAGVLEIDGSDVVTVASGDALAIVNGQVNLPDPETFATIDVLRVERGTVDAEALSRLSVGNALLTRDYAFTAVADGDGARVRVEVKPMATSDVTWTGAAGGGWSAPGNWSPANVPTISANATFPSSAATKEVGIASAASALSLAVADGYRFSGAGVLTTPEIALAEGAAAEFLNPVALPTKARLAVPAGAALTLAGGLSAPDVTAHVVGEGQVTVSGDNGGFAGSWNLLGATGTVEFASANASGAGAAMSVGPATVRFSGDGPVTVAQPLTLDPGAEMAASILDVRTDAELRAGIGSLSGAFVKTGAGRLDVTFPAGKAYTLAHSLPDSGIVQRGPYRPIVLPEGGSGVFGADSGLASVNVLEGTMTIDGAPGVTVADSQKYGVVGGNYPNGTANAVLHVKRVTLSLGGYDNPFVVGNFAPEEALRNPALVVTDGATVKVNEFALGAQSSAAADGRVTPFYPTLAVTNATFTSRWNLNVGAARWYQHATIHPVLRIGPGGVVNQDRAPQLDFGRNADVIVDGGTLADAAATYLGFPGGEYGGTGKCRAYSGSFRFLNGGTFLVSSLRSAFELEDKSLTTDFLFDGGVLGLKATAASYADDPANVTFTTQGAGMEIRVGAGVVHEFAFPIGGSGGLVKTGAGTLVLTNRASDVIGKIAAFTGPLEVREGVVDFCGADVSNLGAARGAGTIRNATGLATLAAVKGATAATVPTLDSVTLARRVEVDFAGTAWSKRETVPVFRIGAAALPALRAVNVGEGLSAVFDAVDGIVWATVCDTPGFVLMVK